MYSPLFYLFKNNSFSMKNSRKKILSKSREVELENRKILERIKDIKGIFYNDELGVLTVTEEISEKKYREILYWLRINGYDDFANVLLCLFEDTHEKYFFERTHSNSELDSWHRDFMIKGGNIFFAGGICPVFWLEWDATLEVVNKKQALAGFWIALFTYELMVENIINRVMSKYIFEVYEKNRCSFIYKASDMLKKEKEYLPNPFYKNIGQILEEAEKVLNTKKMFTQFGLKITDLRDKTFYPLQKFSLGLGEIKKNSQKKVYELIIAKVKKAKALEETKKEKKESKIQDNHMKISLGELKKGTEKADEKLELELDKQGKPSIRINGKSITIEERFFVDLVYLAAAKLKKANSWVDIKKELKWSKRNIKDYPTDLKKSLEKGIYNKEVNRESFLERIPKQGKVRLGVFTDIFINKNLRKFNSEHLRTVKETIDDISYDLECHKAGGERITTEITNAAVDKQEINLDKIDEQELRPMLRHVFVVLQAVKIMGWEFHNPTWFKEWKGFLKKCLKIYELAEFDNKHQKDSEQYLRSYIGLFSRI